MRFIVDENADKDFGEKVYRERHPHTGIILLRLSDQRSLNRLNAMKRLLKKYSARLAGEFVVVTEKSVRFAKI